MKYTDFDKDVSSMPGSVLAFGGNALHSSSSARNWICVFRQNNLRQIETKSAGQGSARQRPQRDRLCEDAKLAICGDLVLELVSLVNSVMREDILAKRRGHHAVSHARQQVMYLLHTSLGFTFKQVADWLNKDRTTVSHACKVIEDMRDSPEFDRAMEGMEVILKKTWELGHG